MLCATSEDTAREQFTSHAWGARSSPPHSAGARVGVTSTRHVHRSLRAEAQAVARGLPRRRGNTNSDKSANGGVAVA